MAGAIRQGRGQRVQLALLAATAVVSWSLAIALRIEPVRKTLLTPLGLADSVPVPTGASDPTAATNGTAAAPTASGVPAPVASASPAAPSAPAASASAATEASAPQPSANPSAIPEGSSSADVDPANRPPLDPVTACVGSLLAPGAFDRGRPNVEFVCKERYPRKAVTRLQSQISLGQWGTDRATEGMREWAALGWYELAALSLFRGYCCDDARTLLWTFRVVCPLNKAMGRIEAAVARGDNRGLVAALTEYTQSAICLTKQGQAANFSQSDMPGPGINALQKMLDRRKKGKARP